ncbi:MAG: hypothetical protein ACO22U_17205, partial [bacterium]
HLKMVLAHFSYVQIFYPLREWLQNASMDVMAEGCPPHIYAHPRGISDCRTKAPEGADELQFNTRVLPSF